MQPHYTEAFRKSQRLSETFLDRFWYRVQKTDGCWLWIGGKSNTTQYVTYGKMSRGAAVDGELAAHVASWLIHNGEVPCGMFVCHTCDNGICVNPTHLHLGTHADNMKDMVDRGRSCKGEKNPRAILSKEIVLKIRELYSTTIPNQRALSRMFKVDFRTINYIVHRKLWAHV